MRWWASPVVGMLLGVACALPPFAQRQGSREAAIATDLSGGEPAQPVVWVPQKPIIPPRVAFLAGLLPLRALGIDTFRLNFPQFDGRGVVIAILDNGIDPGIAGLTRTSTNAPKLLDLRDFSGEGSIPLEQVEWAGGDTVFVAGHVLSGFRNLSREAGPPYFAGVLQERKLGVSPAADVNGNGRATDEFPLIVLRHRGDWIVVTDTDGDRSLAGEKFIRDFAVAREIFSYVGSPDATTPGPLTFAANIGHNGSAPTLDLFFDDSGHGTHVAGVAAGYEMFGVKGFDGVAPGAQLLGLKIADNSRGGISVSGSVVKAMDYAAAYAAQHDVPLVINMSHGIGNEVDGAAEIDSIINRFTFKHPDVLFVVSAGNDGPGVSSVGFPGSAEHALSVGALYPSVFANDPNQGIRPERDNVAPWSARGAEVAKPDLCAPGKAFSTVPLWLSGKEVLEGTSQAAPQIAGAAAVLLSAVRARNRAVRAVEIARALKNTAERPPGMTALDVGAGVPNLSAAYNWLQAGHQAGVYTVTPLVQDDGRRHGSAAYRRSGLASSADTVQRFLVKSEIGQPAARFLLHSDVDWIRPPAVVDAQGGPITIELIYDRTKLKEPGIYVGTVFARSATNISAGALFELVNTVVVPQGLSTPLGGKYKLEPGSLQRHFVEVPDGAGGLQVVVSLPDPSSLATLYLFEPDGRPVSDQSEKTVGGFKTSSASINVAVNDLVSGVYEAVIAVPPAHEAFYALEIAVPDIAVESVRDGPVAVVRNLARNRVRATVSADLIGAVSGFSVAGSGSMPRSLRVTPPQWADRMLLEVTLSKTDWNRITGFGVTVFDTAGVRVSDGPLNYSGARQIVELSSPAHFGGLDVELLPAFARGDLKREWVAELEVTFLLPEAVGLMLPDSSERAGVVLEALAVKEVGFVLDPIWHGTLRDLMPLVEVVARLPVGPPSIRRGAAVSRESAMDHVVPEFVISSEARSN